MLPGFGNARDNVGVDGGKVLDTLSDIVTRGQDTSLVCFSSALALALDVHGLGCLLGLELLAVLEHMLAFACADLSGGATGSFPLGGRRALYELLHVGDVGGCGMGRSGNE